MVGFGIAWFRAPTHGPTKINVKIDSIIAFFVIPFKVQTGRISSKQSTVIVFIYPQASSSGISRKDPRRLLSSSWHGQWLDGSVKLQCSWAIIYYYSIASTWFPLFINLFKLHPHSWPWLQLIPVYFNIHWKINNF